MLQLIDLQVGYGRTAVVHGVTVEVPPDGVTAVMGHNGAGKTTLLRAAVGLLPARSGRDPAGRRGRHRGCAPHQRVRARAWPTCRRASSRFPQLTTAENLQLVADGRARRRGADRRGAGPVPGAARRCSAGGPGCSPAASASSWPSPGR